MYLYTKLHQSHIAIAKGDLPSPKATSQKVEGRRSKVEGRRSKVEGRSSYEVLYAKVGCILIKIDKR